MLSLTRPLEPSLPYLSFLEKAYMRFEGQKASSHLFTTNFEDQNEDHGDVFDSLNLAVMISFSLTTSLSE